MSRKMLTGADMNSQRITNVGTPTSPNDASNKAYTDAAIRGIKWRYADAATNTNQSVSAFSGTTLDGSPTLTSGTSVLLLMNQTTTTENGLWVYNGNGSALTRHPDLTTGDDARGIAVTVRGGTTFDDKVYIQTADPAIIGTNSPVFAQLGGGSSYSADGNGIEESGTVFSIELDGTTLSKSSSGLRVGSGAAGVGLTEASGVLAVNPGTGLETSGDTVRLATQGAGIAGGAGSTLSIDTSVVARRAAFASSAAQTTVCTHSFGTEDVIVQVYDQTGKNIVEADVSARTTSAVTVDFGAAVTANQYRIVVIG